MLAGNRFITQGEDITLSGFCTRPHPQEKYSDFGQRNVNECLFWKQTKAEHFSIIAAFSVIFYFHFYRPHCVFSEFSQSRKAKIIIYVMKCLPTSRQYICNDIVCEKVIHWFTCFFYSNCNIIVVIIKAKNFSNQEWPRHFVCFTFKEPVERFPKIFTTKILFAFQYIFSIFSKTI